MSSAGWSHRGRILFNASRVYYLPDEPSLPPLRWLSEKQQFAYLSSTNTEDVELRASITELAQACSQLYQLQSVQQQSIAASLSGYLPCEALYGVLPLGAANSALLYVTEKEYVCSLSVGGASHDVFAVRGLQWLILPCVTSSSALHRRRRRRERRRQRSRRGSATEDGEDYPHDGAAQQSGRARRKYSDEESANDGNSATDTDEEESEEADGDDESDEVGRLPNKTVCNYLSVLHRFCESINVQDGGQHAEAHRHNSSTSNDNGAAETADQEGGGGELPGIVGPPGQFSYLYYSPTLDLSADPVHLLGLLTHTPQPSLALSCAATATAGSGCGNGSAAAQSDNPSLTSDPHRESSNSGTTVTESSETSRAARRPRTVWEDLRAAATTRELYQWNGPLTKEGLALPTMAVLLEEQMRRWQEADKDGEAASDGRLPWDCVCAEELQREEQRVAAAAAAAAATAPTPQQHARFLNGAAPSIPPPSSSSLPLYIPSFMRGLVASAEAAPALDMTLITRMCCRWAGTRYNRRGLEPGHSGVVANMSMTSLWVTPRPGATKPSVPADTADKREADAGDARADVAAVPLSFPFAVYTVMRGSVPRRWEQPANLALKPTIKISPVGNAADELGRHVRLLKQSLPQLHTLYCLDTMSGSKLEEPLAEAFAVAMRRYTDDASTAAAKPLSGSPGANGSLMEEREMTTSGLGSGDAGNINHSVTAAAAAAATTQDPTVTLVKYNVKKALQTLDYEQMMRGCLAELDRVAGGEGWLDFTEGHARSVVGSDKAHDATVPSLGASQNSRLSGSGGACSAGAHDGAGKDGGVNSAASTLSGARLRLEHLQTRLVRVNCLDCLDRTNLVQSVLCCAVLPRMMAFVDPTCGVESDGKDVRSAEETATWCLRQPVYAAASYRLRVLLAAQGMAISQLYAGTEPHFVPFMLTGHHHRLHKSVEAVLALRRWYQQSFFDGVKQDGVSLVTRQHNPQVFNADIESPFSRDLSGMNRQVLYGVLLSVLPFVYSLGMCVASGGIGSSVFQLHFAICLCWMVYLTVLYNKLMRYRVTYTNRPLLLYTRQADWC